MLLEREQHPVDADNIARCIEEAINQPFACGDVTVSVGCSIGIAWCEPGMDVQTLMHRADLTMYTVKQTHKQPNRED